VRRTNNNLLLPTEWPGEDTFAVIPISAACKTTCVVINGVCFFADATSWQYGRPAGVAFAFQVSANKIEPAPSKRRFNLLSKDCCRAPLGDERKPARPQVTLVIGRLACAGCREGLAGAGTCPNRSVIGPAGKPKRDRPSADAGEEVALGVSAQVVGAHVGDAPLIDVARGDEPFADEIAEPLGRIRINLVVVGGHQLEVIATRPPSGLTNE
jgi:hypothetical protein